MGFCFHQKFYNIPDLLVVTIPGIHNYIYCIIEDTPENRELLFEDVNFKRGNREVEFIDNDYLIERITKGYDLIQELQKKGGKNI